MTDLCCTLTVDELNKPIEELLSIVQERNLVQLPVERLGDLPQPVIFTNKQGFTYPFEQQWKFCRAKFSDESIEKVNLLYDTVCRQLVLDNVRSRNGLTLAEELAIRNKRTPEEIVCAKKLDNRDRRKARGSELNARRNEQNAIRRRRKIESQKTVSTAVSLQEPQELQELQEPQELEDSAIVSFPSGASPAGTPAAVDVYDERFDSQALDVQFPNSEAAGIETPEIEAPNSELEPHIAFSDHEVLFVDGINAVQGELLQGDQRANIANPAEREEQPEERATRSAATRRGAARGTSAAALRTAAIRRTVATRKLRNRVTPNYAENLDNGPEAPDNTYRPVRDPEICRGHTYDPFGVLKPHPHPRPCYPSQIQSTAYTVKWFRNAVPCTTINEVFEVLNAGQQRFSRDSALLAEADFPSRQRIVDSNSLVPQICHLSVGDAIDDWNSVERAGNKVTSYLRSGELLKGYVFQRCSIENQTRGGKCITVSFTCANYQRFTRNEGTRHFRTSRSCSPLNCLGQFDVRVYLTEKIVAFRHRHKHHVTEQRDRESVAEAQNIKQTVEEFIDSKLAFRMSKDLIVDAIKDRVPGASRGDVEKTYDKAFRSRHVLNSSDWRSCLQTLETHQSVYAPFVFYSQEEMGLAVMFKEILALLPKKIECVALDSACNISMHNCEMFVAFAIVDKIGIPIGYMFVKKTAAVAKEVRNSMRRGARRANNMPMLDRPLEQCEIAKSINEVANRRFQGLAQSSLIASFLMLFHGTDKALCIDDSGCRPDLDSEVDEASEVCSMAVDSLSPELAFKRFSGFDIPIFTSNKDSSELYGMKFAFPRADVKLYFWHMLRSVRSAIVKRKQSHSVIEFLKRGDFPDVFARVCPALFDHTPHSPDHCPNILQDGSPKQGFKCLQCRPEVYTQWLDPSIGVSKQGNAYNEPEHSPTQRLPDAPTGQWQDDVIAPLQEGAIAPLQEASTDPPQVASGNCTFGKIKTLLLEHSRCIWMVPQIFLHVPLFTENVSEDAVYYSPRQLPELVIADMLAFCLEYRILDVLQYFWDQWYCGDRLCNWSQCGNLFYNPFTTITISEGNNNAFKGFFGAKRSAIRLDRLMYVDREEELPEHIEKLRVLLDDNARKSHFDTFDEYQPSWVKARWSVISKLSKYSLNNVVIPRETYGEDCEKFGTDAQKFVCGCHAYKKYNIHLCEHIARAIDHRSFSGSNKRLVKINLRARTTAPFYLTCDSRLEENPSRDNQWGGLSFRQEYVEFWNTDGMSILEVKGGIQTPIIPSVEFSSRSRIGTGRSRAREMPTIEFLRVLPDPQTSTESDSSTRGTTESDFPTRVGGTLSPFGIAASCLDCIPPPYLQAEALQTVNIEMEVFAQMAQEILEAEIFRLSRASSSVLSRNGTSSLKVAVLNMPEEIRKQFLHVAMETRLFGGAFPSSLIPDSALPRLEMYTSLTMRSTV